MQRIIASVLAFVILTSVCPETCAIAITNPFTALKNKVVSYKERRQERKEAANQAKEANQALNNLSTVITTLSAKLKKVCKQFSSARSLLIKQTDRDDPRIDETYLISMANIFQSVNATYENYERGMNLFGQGLTAVLKILNQGKKEELSVSEQKKETAGIEKMNVGLKKLRSAYADLCTIRAAICLLWQYVAFTIENPPSPSKSDEDEQAATAEPVCNIFSSGVLTTAVSNIREMMHERKTTFLRKTEEGLNGILNKTISALSVAASPQEDLNKLIEGVKDQIQYITQYNDEVQTLFTVIDTLAKAIKTENIDTETINKEIETLRKALNPPPEDKVQPQEA